MSRRAITAACSAGLAALFSTPATAAPFTAGQLVVVRVDTASIIGAGMSAGAINLVQFDPSGGAGSVIQSVTTSNGVRLDSSSTNNAIEGTLSRSPDGTLLSLAGYVGNSGAGTTVRGNVTVQGAGTTTLRTYNNLSSLRTGFATGLTTTWTGESDGIRYVGTPANQKFSLSADVRFITGTADHLYYSTSTGIFRFAGHPTAAASTSSLVAAKGSGSAREFAVSADGLTLYVADDRPTPSGGGLEKWTWDAANSRFALQYTIRTIMPSDGGTFGIRGLAVDFATNTVFATTAHTTGNRIVRIADGGSAAASTITELAAAATNTIFRGLELAPDDSNFQTTAAPSVAFGRVLKGAGASRTIDFTNAGHTLSTVTVTASGDASGEVTPGVVGNAAAKAVGVAIDTSAAGDVTGSVTVKGTSRIDTPETLAVTGTVVTGSTASLAESDVSLGSLALGGGSQQVTLAKLITALAGPDGAALTAGLDLDSITPLSGDTDVIGLGGDAFDDLAAGSTADLTATVLTDAAGTYAATFRLAFSDADDVLGGSVFGAQFADVTLNVQVVHAPEPTAVGVVSIAGAASLARRPRRR